MSIHISITNSCPFLTRTYKDLLPKRKKNYNKLFDLDQKSISIHASVSNKCSVSLPFWVQEAPTN